MNPGRYPVGNPEADRIRRVLESAHPDYRWSILLSADGDYFEARCVFTAYAVTQVADRASDEALKELGADLIRAVGFELQARLRADRGRKDP